MRAFFKNRSILRLVLPAHTPAFSSSRQRQNKRTASVIKKTTLFFIASARYIQNPKKSLFEKITVVSVRGSCVGTPMAVRLL
jgi:hypothetical protein